MGARAGADSAKLKQTLAPASAKLKQGQHQSGAPIRARRSQGGQRSSAATAAARGVMVVAKKAKLRLSRTGRGPPPQPSDPPFPHPQVSHVLSRREGGPGVHPEGTRAFPHPTRTERSRSPADWGKKPSRNVTPGLTEPPLVPAARIDRRKPRPTAAPRSRRIPRGSAPTISSPSSAWRARSASGCCRRRNPSPSSESALRAGRVAYT